MTRRLHWFVTLVVLLLGSTINAGAAPLALHPENPHYFLFRNKPTVLITSAEHYGAVLNLNFHYASPPSAVPLNYGLNKVIGDNETGFKGTSDDHYRMEAWEFILAGGGLYNNLDYSFTAGHEDGTFQYPPKQPGGGNVGFRQQMKRLKEFIDSFEFVKMKPSREIVREVLPKEARCQILAETGRQYAAYFHGASGYAFTLDLPPGSYRIQWLDVVTGREQTPPRLQHPGGAARFQVPADAPECAFKLVLEAE